LSDHLTRNQIDGYGRRALPAVELLPVADHLEACDSCRRQIERALDGDTAFFSLKSEVFGETVMPSALAGRAHLSVEQTAQYVDDSLAVEELQIVKDHLSGCEHCVAAVNDLRAFRAKVAPDLGREYQPARVASETRWHRYVARFSSLLPRPPALVWGSALTAILLVLAGWLIWRATQGDEKKPEIVKTTPSPTAPALTPVVSPTGPPEDPAQMVIAQLNDGEGQVTLDRDGNLSGVDRLLPAHQQLIKRALTDQQLEKSPLLAGLARPEPLLLRSGDNEGSTFSVIEPIGKVVPPDRPAFRWSRLAGATGYTVEIYDEKFNLVLASSQLTGNSWTASQSLKRGELYSWQVKASKDGQELVCPRPPAPQAKFRILDRANATELARARRNHASSRLTLALLYTQAGLLNEAERELRALQTANPNSAIARRLLANVRAMRR